MRSILLTVPDDMKAQLDAKRAEGYSLNGFIRRALARALTESPPPRTGRVGLQYRKPGGTWQHRAVTPRQLEATILQLKDAGAEIVVGKHARRGSGRAA
jgi:hypothetical protein